MLAALVSQQAVAQIIPPYGSLSSGGGVGGDLSLQLSNGLQSGLLNQILGQGQNPTNSSVQPPQSVPVSANTSVNGQAQSGKIFGDQLFGGTFRAALNPGFNPDYQIAIGDRVQLHLWGALNFDGSALVDAKGNIFVPNVGSIMVAGVPNGELNRVVEAGVRKIFRSGTWVYAALDVSQPVKVFVTGYVSKPGLYAGVASDSAISFLDKAGGVDQDRGSYIDILVKRGNQIRKHINLYKFLQEGTLDLVQFQDGDVIVVGSRSHRFSVSGDVLNEMDFEFGQSNVSLKYALGMAKVKPGASHVSIVRKQGSERRSEYYPINEIENVLVNDGDVVSVYTDRYPGTIQVRIDGAHSGSHAMILPYGATLNDVLATVKPNAMSRMDAIYLVRRSVMERQKDMLTLALQKLEESVLSARSKTSEEASLRNTEASLILRFIDRGKQVQPKGQVVLNNSQRASTLLEDGDVIVIPQRTSLSMVHGEVLFPAAIAWKPGSDAQYYIDQAGGFTQGADTSKIILMRQNGATLLADSSTQIESGDEIMVLPRLETKNYEVTRALTQIFYQIAFVARVAFGLK